MKSKLPLLALAWVAAAMSVASSRPVQAEEILMALWRGPTESEEAFKARLAELGHTVTYTEIDPKQDRGTLATEIRAMDADLGAGKYAIVYTYGTTVTQTVTGLLKGKVPVVFNIVAAPVDAGLVKSMEEPGQPVTGATNGVPVEDQFEALSSIAPLGKVAVLFNAREANSKIIEKKITDWADAKKVSLTSVRVAPETDLLDKAIADIESGKIPADTIYLPADTYLASEAKKIIDKLGGKVRIYGGTETFVLRGALAAYAPQVSDMGKAAADIAAKVLAGENPAKIPVVLPKPQLIVSKAAAAQLNLEVPADAVVRN